MKTEVYGTLLVLTSLRGFTMLGATFAFIQ